MDSLFGDAAERLFAQTCTPHLIRQAEHGQAPATAWQACEAAGFADALVPEAQGGAGLALADVLPLALATGRHLCPYPVVDTVLARAWLARAGHPQAAGSIALAPQGWAVHAGQAVATNVPWIRCADHVLAHIDGHAWLLPAAAATLERGGVHGSLALPARWPLDTRERIDAPAGLPTLETLAAAGYATLIAGAMERVLAMTLDYPNQRSQFGKPIGRFQAVQQQISIMAEQVWAARMAAQLAFQGRAGLPQPLLAALGKARASQAVPRVADIAHAVHGAIGVTEEFDLQLYTRRLREWRLAAGSESYWHARIGAQALADDADAVSYLRSALFDKEAA